MDTASRLLICGSCGELIPSIDICTLESDDSRLHVIGQDQIVVIVTVHRGTFVGNVLRPCPDRQFLPKYSALNRLNVTLCQDFPSALDGLTTVVEECLIARCHPVRTIFKLRPGGYVASVNYYALRGHRIVIPQDPGLP